MLDFVTNLLIFFIITAVFVKESGLEVNRPTSFEQDESTPKAFRSKSSTMARSGWTTAAVDDPCRERERRAPERREPG